MPASARRLFVPGRLCLFGEHSDWAGGYRRTHPRVEPGYCLVTGTDAGLEAEAERADGVLDLASELPAGERRGPDSIPMVAGELDRAARGGGFFSYAAGVAAEVAARHRVGGMRLRTRATLPIRKGLSSSAAVCVLVARAFSRVYDLGLGLREEMELAYQGERRAGSECGRMDQVCAFGCRPTFLRFDGDDLAIEPLEPGGDFHFLLVDLRRGKDTRRILADLNACFPDTPGALAAGVREALGPRNAGILRRAREAMVAGDAPALGELMGEAQALFDRLVAPACRELAAPRLHEVLAHVAVRDLAFGGKGVGSQGDGFAQIVARGPDERARLAARLTDDLDVGVELLDLPGRGSPFPMVSS